MNVDELKKIAEGLIETTELAGIKSIELQKKGLKITTKPDGSPVSNGDLEVNMLLTKKIEKLTPGIPVVSEETVDLKKKNTFSTYWLIDPIDGTKEYIAGKDDYTLNAGLIIDKIPVVGVIGVPKKNKLFYSYGKNNSFMVHERNTVKLTNELRPSQDILNKLKEFGVTSYKKLSCSYKYCVIATGEFDLYADKVNANEWDDAAGQAIAENAGAIVTTLDGKFFKYGKNINNMLMICISRSIVR